MIRYVIVLAFLAVAGCVSPTTPQVGLGECRRGVRHGSYTLQVVNGPVIATGTFVEGRRHGVFTFYTTGGTKVAEIPYDNDEKSGTIRLWYSEFQFPRAAGRLKLQAEYTRNYANGRKQTWWPSGAKRSVELFRDGWFVQAEAWEESGASLSLSKAKELSTTSSQADAEYYHILESEIEAYPPGCIPPAA